MDEYLNILLDTVSIGRSCHLLIEVLLFLWVVWLISRDSVKNELRLSENEKETILRNFKPEPLVTDVSQTHHAIKPRVINGKVGKYITINGVECLNFASHNYLGFIGDNQIEEKTMKTIDTYGVGTCGPGLFYGTTEVHLELERRLNEFMGTEDAVLYSYGFSTLASAIPVYAKKGDIVFADVEVNFAIQKGLDASRSLIKFFKHNDVTDLERILEKTKLKDTQDTRKARKSRRFLVVEGIYANTGKICPLPDLIKLCKKFKLRILIDESISFGILGKTGTGVTEHFGVLKSDVDLIMASLENSIGCYGGFCVGSSLIVDHQRLSGGYCFSGSLPSCHVVAAIEALIKIQENPRLLTYVNSLCKKMHTRLSSSKVINEHFNLSGDKDSPVHLLSLKHQVPFVISQDVINSVIEFCLQDKKAISRATYLHTDLSFKPACLRLTTSIFLSYDDINNLVRTLESACRNIFWEYN